MQKPKAYNASLTQILRLTIKFTDINPSILLDIKDFYLAHKEMTDSQKTKKYGHN